MTLQKSGQITAGDVRTEAKQSGTWDINAPLERKIAKKPGDSTGIKFSDFYGKSRGRCLYYANNWFMAPWGNGGGSGWFGANPVDAGGYNWPFVSWNKDVYQQFSGSSGGPAYYPVIGNGGPIYWTFGCDNYGDIAYATTTDNNADPSTLGYTVLGSSVAFPGYNNWQLLGNFADDLNIWFRISFRDVGRVFGVTLAVSSTPSLDGLMTSTRNLTSNGQPYYCTPGYAIDFTETVWVQPAPPASSGTDTGPGPGWSCFLKGSLVTMADGTTKPIEDVQVGEYLLGAHDTANPVLALNRPLLNDRWMSNINGEHITTLDHAHLRPDNTFGAVSLYEYVHGENNVVQTVITADGSEEQWLLPGFAETDMDLITQIEIGDSLVTVDGARLVKSLEPIKLPADTQLYNFVMGGDHTYFVSDYCVTGFLNGIDFDYRTWQPVGPGWTREQYRRG